MRATASHTRMAGILTEDTSTSGEHIIAEYYVALNPSPPNHKMLILGPQLLHPLAPLYDMFI